MLLKIISYIPAILGLLSIGLFVFLNNPKSNKNRVFAALNLFIALWLLSLFIGDTTKNITVALWSLRFAGLFSIFMFLFFYYFSLVFPFSSKINKFRQIIYALPVYIFALTSFTTLQVSTVSIQDFGVQPEKIGPLYTPLDIVGILYLLIGILILLLKYRKSDIREKNQIKFVLFGLSVAIIVNIFTGLVLTLLKIDTDVILFGSFSLFIFSLFVAFAIIKHGFMDVRLIVARTVGYALTIGSIAGIYGVVAFGITSRFITTTSRTTATQQIIYIALAVFMALTFQPIKRFFDHLSNKLFYRDAYEPQVLLNELNVLLVSQIELSKILHDSAQIIQNHIKSDFVYFRINKTNTTEEKEESMGVTDEQELNILLGTANNEVDQKLIITEELSEKNSELQKDLHKAGVSMVIRMMSSTQENIVGYLVLGQKKSGNFYNKQDTRIMNIIADELVIAIQNSLRFEEIQEFAVTLQQKVNDATAQLKRSNTKLKELDEAKDEFISMASHQLRTPLTSMKGYVSMVLEGDAGKVSEMQRKLLDQAFVSSQRMVYLIADLLNVSRLKTGKFIVETKPTNLAELVEGEISQLYETAKGRNLELTYDKPKDFPELMLDETKIRQVVMNFTDNAIYYTPAGGHIKVVVEDKPETIEFRVEDDGLGVPKAEQHHLFTKFYRAGNARKARPDGTGLGLFMAKKVIAVQGGAIIFHSTEGKGSIFGFSFAKANLQPPKIGPEKKTAKK